MNKSLCLLETILSSTRLKSSPFQTLRLSPNDWLIPATSSITCIYFYDIQHWPTYETGRDTNAFLNTEQLLSSLKQLIDFYPMLAGVLTASDDDNSASVEQDPSNGGVLFVSTSVNIGVSDLSLSRRDFDNGKILTASLQLCNGAESASLFHVRHTRFLCGSVALGISLNHQLADAHSLFQLVSDWAKIHRSHGDYQPIVCHQRSLLEPSLTEIDTLRKSNPDFDHRRSLTAVNKLATSAVKPNKQTLVKVFRFTADELDRMKSDAVDHLSSDSVSYLSTFEVLTAHLHRHVMLARQHSSSSLTRIYMATNIRPRLTHPSIPPTYFGNAIMFSYSEVTMSDLIDDDHLSSTAGRIHRAIEQNDNTDIRTTLAWVLAQPNKSVVIPTCQLDGADFSISAWNKMGMFSNADFETDVRPCRILLPPETQVNGAAILLSTEENTESIDVVLGLEVPEMQRLENNIDFRKYRRQ